MCEKTHSMSLLNEDWVLWLIKRWAFWLIQWDCWMKTVFSLIQKTHWLIQWVFWMKTLFSHTYEKNEWVFLHISIYNTTHSYVWEDSFMYIWGVWKASDLDMSSQFLWHDQSIFLTWPIHVSDMTHQYDWHDSSISLTWLIHMCEMAHSCICGVSGKLLNSVFLVNTCDITHLYVWHDAFRRVAWPINMSHKTHSLRVGWLIQVHVGYMESFWIRCFKSVPVT